MSKTARAQLTALSNSPISRATMGSIQDESEESPVVRGS